MSDRYPDWRLPDSAPDRVWVLAAFVWVDPHGKETTEIIVAMKSGGDWADGDGRSGYRVTHWMPLPQLP